MNEEKKTTFKEFADKCEKEGFSSLFKPKKLIIVQPPSPFIKWLEEVGIPTLKNEIRECEQEGLRAGLIGICEMIYKGSKEEKE